MSLSTKGEGGIIVLKEALISTLKKGKRLSIASALAYIGISLLIGDGIITPAISILSAVEGLELIPDFGEVTTLVVVLITCLITIILFLIQAKWVDRIAKSFGPIMLIWFVCLFVSGAYYILDNPFILKAINPLYGINILLSNGFVSFVILSDVILCATGGEALYADMWHLGGKSIKVGARRDLEASLALCRAIGAQYPEGYALLGLAGVAGEEGDAAAAGRYAGEAIAVRRKIGHHDAEAEALVARGAVRARGGRLAEARADYEAALAIARELSAPVIEYSALAHLAALP